MKGDSMPSSSGPAAVQLNASQDSAGLWNIALKVSSLTYDAASAARRCSLITRVRLVDLPAPGSGGYQFKLRSIGDRHGINVSHLWMQEQGQGFVGFVGYKELTAFLKQPSVGATAWQSFSGVYDDRCAADPDSDKYRYQTVPVGASGNAPVDRLMAFNYLRGPVTFEFTIDRFQRPARIQITLGLIGGNGGQPDQNLPGGVAHLEEDVTMEVP